MHQLSKTTEKEAKKSTQPTATVSQNSALNSPQNQTEQSACSSRQEPKSESLDAGEKAQVVQQENIRLLEEKLVVKRSKRKVGEVVVRKEIETFMVQVPVRREKLIVEQIGSENKRLVEIELGQEEITGIELIQTANSQANNTVKGEFLSPEAVSALLRTIALQDRHGCLKVKIEIVVNNPQLQETYQAMFDRCSGK